MERELGALGQGPHQDQAQGWKIERAVLDDVAGGQYDIQIEATGNPAQNHDTGQKAKTAKSRNREGHARAILGGFRVVPVADQKEGEEAGQLPEEDHLDHVAGHDHTGHRPHEGHQEREETRNRIFGRHVVARIEDYQRTDGLNDQGKQPCEAVKTQAEGDVQSGQPFHAEARDLARGDDRIQAQQGDDADE